MDHWALEDGLRVYKGRVLGNRLELEEGRESCRDTILAEREGERCVYVYLCMYVSIYLSHYSLRRRRSVHSFSLCSVLFCSLPALVISHRPIMDLLPELLLTALFTAVFSLLVAKLLSVATVATDDDSQSREFSGVETRIAELRRERTEFTALLADGGIGKADRFSCQSSVYQSPEEVVSDVVGLIDRDVAVENAVSAVSERKIVERLTVERFAGKRLVDHSPPVQVDDVAAEERCGGQKSDEFDDADKEMADAGVSEEKIVEHVMVGDVIVGDAGGDDDDDRFENSGDSGDIFDKIGGESDVTATLGSSDPVIGDDDVGEENAAPGVSEEKVVEHLTVDDEIGGDVGSDDDSFENSGAVGENVETIGVEGDIKVTVGCCDLVIEGRKLGGFDDVEEEGKLAWVSEEKIVERLTVDDEIVEDQRGNNDSLENSGAIGENVGKPGVEGDMVLLWSSNPVVDDDVAVEERSGRKKLDECDNVDGENSVAGVSEAKGVENAEADSDGLPNFGANDEKIESAGVETDVMVSSGRNEPLANEVAVEEKSEGRTLEGENGVAEENIVEHEGVDNDSSEISGANVGKIENIEDIMVNLGGCGDDAVVNQGSQSSNIIENVEEERLIVDENNEKAKVNDEIVTNIGSSDEKIIDEDDDWEGIERSELEKDFAAAANYVFFGDKDVCKPKLDNDVRMELYGLNKIALEGPCREPQPMAIKVSARAKWNAWQKLGNMSPEVAMEQYISLLSDKAPEWMEGKSSGDGCKYHSRVSEASPPDLGTGLENQLNPKNESVLELNSATEGDLTGGSFSVNKI